MMLSSFHLLDIPLAYPIERELKSIPLKLQSCHVILRRGLPLMPFLKETILVHNQHQSRMASLDFERLLASPMSVGHVNQDQ